VTHKIDLQYVLVVILIVFIVSLQVGIRYGQHMGWITCADELGFVEE
jgi:hypothetical protein